MRRKSREVRMGNETINVLNTEQKLRTPEGGDWAKVSPSSTAILSRSVNSGAHRDLNTSDRAQLLLFVLSFCQYLIGRKF